MFGLRQSLKVTQDPYINYMPNWYAIRNTVCN
jgi:hypothetical protein